MDQLESTLLIHFKGRVLTYPESTITHSWELARNGGIWTVSSLPKPRPENVEYLSLMEHILNHASKKPEPPHEDYLLVLDQRLLLAWAMRLCGLWEASPDLPLLGTDLCSHPREPTLCQSLVQLQCPECGLSTPTLSTLSEKHSSGLRSYGKNLSGISESIATIGVPSRLLRR